MTTHERIETEGGVPLLAKTDPSQPALKVTARASLVIRAGTTFAGHAFTEDRPVGMPALEAGCDYAVAVGPDGLAAAVKLDAKPAASSSIGGFHVAPGGNAAARAGGDNIPAINPCSLWDIHFRPVCADPRGMALVEMPGGRFWCDIYLTGVDCRTDGTSRFGVTIADGEDCPRGADGARTKVFDYAAAKAVMESCGKGLLSVEEFFAAAFGVTERTAARSDPKTTGLDAPRTSRFGIMQATGNMWVWGHDGDPDAPRASMFGGSWLYDGSAGSRFADVACLWPGVSYGPLGARGRSDHLQLG